MGGAGMAAKVDMAALTASSYPRREWFLPLVGTAAGIAFAAAFSTTVRVFRGFARARDSAFDPPQAILVLGGDKERELLAAKFSASLGEKRFTRLVKPASHAAGTRLLPVYISSGHDDVGSIMLHAGVHGSRLKIDNRALDTVTNFTTMLSTFLKAKYTHVYIVTSDYHKARASMVATLVFCSHGIAFTLVTIPSSSEIDNRYNAGPSTSDKGVLALAAKTLGDTKRQGVSAPSRKGRRLETPQDTAQPREAVGTGLELSREDVPNEQAPGSSSFSTSASTSEGGIKRGEPGSSFTKSGLPRPSSLSREILQSLPDEPPSSVPSSPATIPSPVAIASPATTTSSVEPETWLRHERDRVRALLWIVTGFTGAELLRFTKPVRYRLHKQKPLNPDVGTKED